MGAGLHREALLLQNLLATQGITSRLMHYTDGANAPFEHADINISLEVVMPQALSLAKENWLAPNSEWWPPIYDQYLPRFSKILCKTRDCYSIWSAKVGADKCVYTSFMARDLYDAGVPRENRFLHVAGKSGNKGTKAVLDAWQMIPNLLPPLTVVASNPEYMRQFEKNRSNIDFRSKVTEPELARLMNGHKFHVCPSPYEGFGHSIHEGMGCDAFVVTMDAPPFQGYLGTFAIVPVATTIKQRLATMSNADGLGVRSACQKMMAQFEHQVSGSGARGYFLKNNKFFQDMILDLVNAC
jgi:hypothetical protein